MVSIVRHFIYVIAMSASILTSSKPWVCSFIESLMTSLCILVWTLAEQMSFLRHRQNVWPFAHSLSNTYIKPSWCKTSQFLLKWINIIIIDKVLIALTQCYKSCLTKNSTRFRKFFVLTPNRCRLNEPSPKRQRRKVLFSKTTCVLKFQILFLTKLFRDCLKS